MLTYLKKSSGNIRLVANRFCLLILVLTLAGACKYRKIQKSADWRVKYEAALAYFDKKDYSRSSFLFENILPIVRGLPEGENVTFKLGYCHFYEKAYLLAANQFRMFYETYGRSTFVQEALYMRAYSLFKSSPPYNNDQQSTIEAMNAMQSFLNRYPTSTFADQAVDVISNCQRKLEQKNFENGKLYLRLRYYEAAAITLSNFKKKFPDSKYYEEAFALQIKSQFLLAKQSIPSKQLERYNETLELYKEFLEYFPESNFISNIEEYYKDSINEINKFKSNNS